MELTKSETQGSRFYVKQLYHDGKTVWNSLELLLLLLFFNWTFFGLRSGPLDFFGSGSPHSHIPVTNIPEYPRLGKGQVTRPRSQFFTIRTDPKPVNNLFIFFLRTKKTVSIL